MTNQLENRKVAFLATDGFEQVEFTKPWAAMKNAGATVELISLKKGKIQGYNHLDKGNTFTVDKSIDEVKAADYNGLVLPGGVHNPDTLRMNKQAVQFVRDFFKQHKPVAAICHGPWMLVEADVVADRTLTSWPSLKTDIENAGGRWEDKAVVVDEGLTTSRKPEDLDAFCAKAIEELREGKHAAQMA